MHDESLMAQPWWRYGHVWLVISGPVLVIVACVITAYFVMSSPNELVTDDSYRQFVAGKRAQGESVVEGKEAPAMQARNHAQTGVVPIAK